MLVIGCLLGGGAVKSRIQRWLHKGLPGGCFAVFRNLRETHDRTTRCCAPVPGALAMLAFSCQFPAGACGANSSFIIHHWPTAPWMLARASAKRMHCTEGFTAKTQREARLNPSETDLPRFFLILRRNPMLK